MADKVHIATDPIDTLDKPRFDFSRVSYKRARESNRLHEQIKHMDKRIDAATADMDIEPLLDEMDALLDRQEVYIMEAVEYVPRAWLMVGSPDPETINWQDHDSMKWLRPDKFRALGKAKQAAETDSPN